MQFLKITDRAQLQNLKNAWENLLDKHWKEENLDDLFRSFDWIEHLVFQKKNQNVYLAIAKVDTDRIIGIIPFTLTEYKLKFDIKSYTLFAKSRRVAWILGNDLLLPHTNNLYNRFFDDLYNAFPDAQGIYFETVKSDSFLYNYLKRPGAVRDRYFLYYPEHYRSYYYIVFPDSFETFRTSLKSKRRRELEKKIESIRAHFGEIQLKCYQTEDSVEPFLDQAMKVVKKSWQFQVIGKRIDDSTAGMENKMDLARRQIFHSFVLFGGDKPLAFSMGYKYRATYIGDEIAYDKDSAEFSPGSVLIYLLIGDLIKDGIRRLNMGVGEGYHKVGFANRELTDTSVLMLKKNLSNSVSIFVHNNFMIVKRLIKKMVKTTQN